MKTFPATLALCALALAAQPVRAQDERFRVSLSGPDSISAGGADILVSIDHIGNGLGALSWLLGVEVSGGDATGFTIEWARQIRIHSHGSCIEVSGCLSHRTGFIDLLLWDLHSLCKRG